MSCFPVAISSSCQGIVWANPASTLSADQNTLIIFKLVDNIVKPCARNRIQVPSLTLFDLSFKIPKVYSLLRIQQQRALSAICRQTPRSIRPVVFSKIQHYERLNFANCFGKNDARWFSSTRRQGLSSNDFIPATSDRKKWFFNCFFQWATLKHDGV